MAGDDKQDKLLDFVLDYAEGGTKETLELVRKLTETVTNLTTAFANGPSGRELHEALKSLDNSLEIKANTLISKLDQKILEIDKGDKEKIESLKEFLKSEFKATLDATILKHVETSEFLDKKVATKIDAIERKLFHLMIILFAAATAVAFVLGYVKGVF